MRFTLKKDAEAFQKEAGQLEESWTGPHGKKGTSEVEKEGDCGNSPQRLYRLLRKREPFHNMGRTWRGGGTC